MGESKLRWQKNDAGGVTLQRWVPPKTHTSSRTTTTFVYTAPGYWQAVADVYKAKRGGRYVVRVMRPTASGFEQYQAFTLREAMRIAKFIVGVKYEN